MSRHVNQAILRGFLAFLISNAESQERFRMKMRAVCFDRPNWQCRESERFLERLTQAIVLKAFVAFPKRRKHRETEFATMLLAALPSRSSRLDDGRTHGVGRSKPNWTQTWCLNSVLVEVLIGQNHIVEIGCDADFFVAEVIYPSDSLACCFRKPRHDLAQWNRHPLGVGFAR